jgi:hypothetical protein
MHVAPLVALGHSPAVGKPCSIIDCQNTTWRVFDLVGWPATPEGCDLISAGGRSPLLGLFRRTILFRAVQLPPANASQQGTVLAAWFSGHHAHIFIYQATGETSSRRLCPVRLCCADAVHVSRPLQKLLFHLGRYHMCLQVSCTLHPACWMLAFYWHSRLRL